MRLLQDGVIAALAAVGLTTLIWLLVGALMHPQEHCARALALVKAQDAAEELEHTVRSLQRTRYETRSFSQIVIVDCGMSEEAQKIAQALCREECGVELAAKDSLIDLIG